MVIDQVEQETLVRRAQLHAALGEPSRLAVVEALALGDRSPGELAAALGVAGNLLAHHLKVLEEAGVVRRRRSEGDRRRTYLALVPDALPQLQVGPAPVASRLVFVCTHNSARSQLATALWRERSRVPVASAGTRPAARVNPLAARAARRHGVSLRSARPQHVDDVLRADDLVVSVCDGAYEALGATHLHWSVPDPARVGTDDAFEAAYREIDQRVGHLADVVTLQEEPEP